MARFDHRAGEEGLAPHSFFVPMVDLLAGVVFVLVIMLAASVLVTRPDFGAAQAMQAELQRISAELEAARAAERLLLDPRREAEAARRLLLERLRARLAAAGLVVQVTPDDGRLAVIQAGLSAGNAGGAGENANPVLQSVADALAAELPCLAAGASGVVDCGIYGKAMLETVEIIAPSEPADSNAEARSRSLSLLSEIAELRPSLIVLSGASGAPILTYGVADVAPGGGTDRFEMKFQMRLPAMP